MRFEENKNASRKYSGFKMKNLKNIYARQNVTKIVLHVAVNYVSTLCPFHAFVHRPYLSINGQLHDYSYRK